MTHKLLEPIRLRDTQLRNRVMISPMCQYSAEPDGRATDWHLAHYGRFAIGGAGLVMVEASAVSADGRLSYGDLGIWSDDHIPGLARIAKLIEGQGAVAGIQIGHAGRKASSQRPWHGNGPLEADDLSQRGEMPWQTVSVSSGANAAGWPAPAALTVEEIRAAVNTWKRAAERAFEAGFRVIEIHAAHGYLLNVFLSPLSNRRTDEYGGDRASRMRFPLEVAAAVRSAWPDGLPLFCRISSIDAAKDGWAIEDSVQLAIALRERGVDVIDCSSGGIGGDFSVIPRGPGFQVSFADQIKHAADIPTVAVGLITDPGLAANIIEREQADLVAIGREAMYNPHWPLHAAMALEPDRGFSGWPTQSGWWLDRRKMPRSP
jgi:2,4-dienoyl-CoA reductase-like NADH-dependent reductase (Old Yellow Enzyme family)